MSNSFPPDHSLTRFPSPDFNDTFVQSGLVTLDNPFPSSDFQPFTSIPAVLDILRNLTIQKSFSPSYFRKLANKLLQSTLSHGSPIVSLTKVKPHASSVIAMFDENLFQYGDDPLPFNEQFINPEGAAALHVKYCSNCQIFGELDHLCYFYPMYRCLRNGWSPPMSAPGPIITHYHSKPLSKKDPFYDTKLSKIRKLLALGFVAPLDPTLPESTPLVLTPINIVFKKSELHRASLISPIQPVCDVTLVALNEALTAAGQPILKPRLVLDHTGSGLNDLLQTIPFSNTTFNDLIALVEENDFVAITDINHYFNMFPLARNARRLFAFQVESQIFVCVTCSFGGKPTPAFCLTFSAEFVHWFRSEGIKATMMTDDIALVGSDEALAVDARTRVEAMLTSIGFSFSDEKRQLGQQVTYLGVNIDTSRMVTSISVEKAICAGKILTSLTSRLIDTSIPKSHVLSELSSVAGLLNFFAETLQPGRLHIRSSWCYKSELCLPPHAATSKSNLPRLLSDLSWWHNVLSTWSTGGLSGTEYPILNGDFFFNNRDSTYVCMSDASGTDGLGFIHGRLHDINPAYYSSRWSASSLPPSSRSADTNLPDSSHSAELAAFLEYLIIIVVNGGPPATSCFRNCFLIWISDAASAVWSFNKGYTPAPQSFAVLSKIFDIITDYNLFVVALWIPRTLNSNADFLSHFSHIVNRDFLDGNIGDWAYTANFRRYRGEEIFPGSPADSFGLSGSLQGEGSLSISSDSCRSPPVLSKIYDGKFWFDQISSDSDFSPESRISCEAPPMDGPDRQRACEILDQGGQIPGPVPIQRQSPSDSGGNSTYPIPSPQLQARDPAGHHYLARARRFVETGRNTARSQSFLDCLGSQSPIFPAHPLPLQDSPERPPRDDSIHLQGGTMRSEKHE